MDTFGQTCSGEPVHRIVLRAGAVEAAVITLGSTLQALSLPDRNGALADVTLGYDDLAGYEADTAYFGCTVGRCANRIRDGRFALDGALVQLDRNDGPHHLHGGALGLHRKVWPVVAVDADSLLLETDSADGEGGYPGAVKVSCRWTLSPDRLRITLTAETDRTTLINLTNHTYWNLAGAAGERDVLDQRLTVAAERYTPVDAGLIPTGEIADVAGTPFDFRQARPTREGALRLDHHQIAHAGGLDHNLIIAGEGVSRAARLEDAESGRRLEVWSDAPGLQVYSGNFLDGSVAGKGERLYPKHHGLCLEPQVWPDSPNHADFPSAVLRPGDTYRRVVEYRW